jgi:pimeloyl-ACP methyl ester carboxylesterase
MATAPPWTHRFLTVGGIRLHVAEAGAGPPVVLLHGFPEFWYSWRHQLAALAAAGFLAVAPDQRGYNESAKPPHLRDYRLHLLVEDIAGLIAELGHQRAAVVGHDWGGGIAWALAMRHPERVERLAILNAPHPAAFARELRNPAQWLRSWYIGFFQVPWLPECLLSAGNFALMERAFRRQPTSADAFRPEDIRLYKQALSRRGALTAALNYYRALVRYPTERRGIRRITAPTLLIWGERDPYLGIGMTQGLERWVPQVRVERLAGVSHWVQNDAPQRVNELLIDFLRPMTEPSPQPG